MNKDNLVTNKRYVATSFMNFCKPLVALEMKLSVNQSFFVTVILVELFNIGIQDILAN